ncbi:MAG: preprotein translocase subunit YajC [Alphaproteobacteria bacterium]|nr:preprotein translocase subunit YajC [Alphaproteobacteria bacterium]
MVDATNILIQSALVLGLFGVLYVALVRPQQRNLQRHRMMLANLQPGDRIATTGGLVGAVDDLDDELTVTVEIAENIRVSIIRAMIDEILNKAE